MKFVPIECPEHSKLVQVNYISFDGLTHKFEVSSLSRPGVTHSVYIRISQFYDSYETPESLLKRGLVQCYSTDDFYLYGGCMYNCTRFKSALYPEFRAPKSPSHDYLCSHTLLAVLDVIIRMKPGSLEDSFSSTLCFDNSTNQYFSYGS